MKIQYLGTAAAEAIPGIFCECELCKKAKKIRGKEIRYRSSIMINDEILIDMGPDINIQRLQFNLDLSKVKTLYITHSHSDHWDVEEFTKRSTADSSHIDNAVPIDVYLNEKANIKVHNCIKEEFRTEEESSFQFHVIHEGDTVEKDCVSVHALHAMHEPREESLCYLIIGENEESFLLANDTGALEEKTYELIQERLNGKKLKAVSMDCTFGMVETDYPYHMNIRQNLEMRDKLISMGCADDKTKWIITHFSHNCKMTHQELSAIGEKNGIEVAYDGLTIQV